MGIYLNQMNQFHYNNTMNLCQLVTYTDMFNYNMAIVS